MDEDDKKAFARLDNIFDDIGSFGKFQFINYLLISFPIFLSGVYTTFYIFSARELKHRCAVDVCDGGGTDFSPSWIQNAIPLSSDQSLSSCTRYPYRNNDTIITNGTYCPSDLFYQNETTSCDHWIYEEYTTIVSEFDLGCEEWKRTLIGTINSAGQFISMPLVGILSDKFGRKTMFIMTNICYGVIGVLKALSPTYWIFFTLEFLESSLSSGAFSIGLVLAMELVDPSKRTLGSMLVSVFYGLGSVFVGLVAWVIPYWRTLILVNYIPVLLVIFYHWLLPESMRWLLLKGKTNEAIRTLRKAALMNNKPVPENSLHELHLTFFKRHENMKQDKSKGEERNKNALSDILKSKILMTRFVFCCTWWMTSTFVYFGMLLNSVAMAGNLYVNYMLVAAIELPSHLVYYYTVDVLGRKITLCWTFIATGLACFAFTFIHQDMYWIRLVVYLFGKFGINIAFTVLYVYTTEIFPTPQRNSLLGLCSMFGRFGSVAAPQTPLLSIYHESLPLFLYGITSIFSGLTVLAFPETNKLKLPDTIEEAENLSKQKPVNGLNIQESY